MCGEPRQALGLAGQVDGLQPQALTRERAPIAAQLRRVVTAAELLGHVADDAVEVADDARAQLSDDAGAVLDAALAALEAVPDEHSGVLGSQGSFTAAAIEAALREALVEGLGIKPRFAFGPLRTAISGRRVSPPLFESMEILGKVATLTRLRARRGM